MQNIWTLWYQKLLERLKEEIVAGPNLARPGLYKPFYIIMDWSKDEMEEVLLQADDSAESRKSDAQENSGGKCQFYNYLVGFCLQPIYFISRLTVSPLENPRHSFVAEADAVR